MAPYLEFKKTQPTREEMFAQKLEDAPLAHAPALLKAYELLQTAEEQGLLEVLKGLIAAENTIIEKVAGYANTPEGINIMRTLLMAGTAMGSVDPDFLKAASGDLAGSVMHESRKEPAGMFGTARRVFSGDAWRGLSIAIAALESLGRTARLRAERQGTSRRGGETSERRDR